MIVNCKNLNVKLNNYHVCGYSAGGPLSYCYSSMYSNEIISIIPISSVGLYNTPNCFNNMSFMFETFWYLIGNHKTISYYVVKNE